MRLSTVRGIYKEVGKEKFRSICKPKVEIKNKKAPLAPNTLNKISKMIKTNRKVSRAYLLEHSGFGRTTTELALKTLFDKFLVKKEKNYSLPNNPAVYVWLGV